MTTVGFFALTQLYELRYSSSSMAISSSVIFAGLSTIATGSACSPSIRVRSGGPEVL